MRVLVAHSARGAIGGIESYLRGVAPRLAARGHAVALVFERRAEAAGAAGADDPYAACAAEWCAEEMGAAEAAAAARAWGPERIWVHGLESRELEARLLAAAPGLRFVHNYDGCCATGEKFRRWPRPAPCGRRMGAACAAINFTRHCGRLRPAGFAAGWARQRERAADFGRYRQLQAASRHMQGELQRQVAGAVPVALLPYPLLEARAAAPAPRPGPPRRVLMLARLTAGKGGAELLQALALAERRLGRRLTVTIAGDGPERDGLMRLARRLQLEAHFPGWVDAAARARLLEEADVLAMPSLWPEPFGLAGLEAAARAVPAVGYAVGGIPDWLAAGESGELAPGAPPTPDGLAQALTRALADTERWNRQRRQAWARSAQFGLAAHLDAVEAALDA
jgi:glycosyltransferase involved in cell wall biosynthesis